MITAREPRLLLLGTSDQFGATVPDGMTLIPISCQSEGAMEVYIEPVLPTPHLVVVGRSPMAQTLVDLAKVLGWRSELIGAAEFSSADLDARAIVVVATQGHGDEEAVERALAASPAYVGLVASRRRGESVLGYLADRGVPEDLLGQVHVPVGIDLGHTSHREIAVTVLAELVQRRAAGELVPGRSTDAAVVVEPATALDPVCGMTVRADGGSHPVEHDGVTYYFCCAGCHTAFEKNPVAYVAEEARC